MVWGFEPASRFGPFRPDGDFVGYYEQLDANLDSMTPDEQEFYGNSKPAYRLHVCQCLLYEHGTMHGEKRLFRAVEENEWPREYRINRRYPRLGSFMQITGMLLVVDVALKELIEKLEPGIHQFRPIRMSYKPEELHPGEFFTMMIGTFLTSFDPQQSEEFKNIGGCYRSNYFNQINASKLAMKRLQFLNCHLWRERELKTPEFFVSDTLQDEIRRAGLLMPDMYRMKEVLNSAWAVPRANGFPER